MNNRHMFPGGNTSNGFTNYFNGIFPDWEETKRLYILKGGPGVGKNTFMKRLGSFAEEKGYELEFFHCASDSNSLDAVRIPKLNITMLDGTAPHIVDPVYPGAVDEILNLGVYLDANALESKRMDIIRYNTQNSFSYQRTFSYLKAAGALEHFTYNVYKKSINFGKLQSHVRELILPNQKSSADGVCHFRTLFYSAITPLGEIDFSPNSPSGETVIYLEGAKGIAACYLKLALQYAADDGYHGEIFYSALLPDEPEHLNIAELNLCITTTKPVGIHVKTISLSDFADVSFIETQKSFLDFQEAQKAVLIDNAVTSLKVSKEIHDEIELIYSKCIDFSKVTAYCDEALDTIF